MQNAHETLPEIWHLRDTIDKFQSRADTHSYTLQDEDHSCPSCARNPGYHLSVAEEISELLGPLWNHTLYIRHAYSESA